MELSGREVWAVNKHAREKISVPCQMLLNDTFCGLSLELEDSSIRPYIPSISKSREMEWTKSEVMGQRVLN